MLGNKWPSVLWECYDIVLGNKWSFVLRECYVLGNKVALRAEGVLCVGQ